MAAVAAGPLPMRPCAELRVLRGACGCG